MQRLDGADAPIGIPVSLMNDPAAADLSQLSIVPLYAGRVTFVWQNMAIAPLQHVSIYTRVLDAALQPLTPATEKLGLASGECDTATASRMWPTYPLHFQSAQAAD